MDICYVSNENYVPYLAVSLYSLIERNADAARVRVHILSNGIGEESRARLTADAEAASAVAGARSGRTVPDTAGGAELFFYELSDLKERLGAEIDTGNYDISMLGRFFVGELLPAEVETLLYLDCDTLIRKSLLPLFSEPMDARFLAAAVQEPTIYPSILRQLGLIGEGQFYVNSGVLLIDLKRWRKERIGERLVSFYRENGAHLFCGDQDAINYVLSGRICRLSPGSNFFTNYYYFRYRTLCALAPSYRDCVPDRAAFEDAKKNPQILHYMGAERPWIGGNKNPYRREWEECLSGTSFQGLLPKQGQRVRMAAYHGMNLCTAAFPFARRWISRAYERKLVLPRLRPIVKQQEKERETARRRLP